MSQFKNNKDYDLFYSDTDTIFINKPLDPAWISSTELGLMKLESISNKAVFIAPKVYGFKTVEGQEIIKVKGLKKEAIKTLTLKDLEELLFRDKTLEIENTKWYRSLIEAQISIKNQIYSLKMRSNKRLLVYNNNRLILTFPLIFKKSLQD